MKFSNCVVTHDWVKSYGGSEHILTSFCDVLGAYDLYTPIYLSNRCDLYNYGFSGSIKSIDIYSYLSKFNFIPMEILGLLFNALIFESYDLFSYELVISNSHAFSHGVITNSKQCHIVYSNTPMRYVWSGAAEYTTLIRKNFPIISSCVPILMSYLRSWDFIASQRSDYVVAISETVQKRIKKYYKRESVVIYPPVGMVDIVHENNRLLKNQKEDYYITVGRLVPNKNVDLIIKTFNERFPDKLLLIAGAGKEEKRLKKIAKDNLNIKFKGYVSEKEKIKLISQSRGFIFCADEDFGIVPIEAMALGVPVIAYNSGGITENLKSEINGILFDDRTVNSLFEAVKNFEKIKFNKQEISKTVIHLSNARFVREWKEFLIGI